MPIDGFFRDTFATALEPSEVLSEIRIPKAPARSGGAYMKLKRKTGDFATVAAAAQLTLDEQGAVSQVRIGLGAVGPKPFRSTRAEQRLVGGEPESGALAEASKLAAQDARPTSDLRGSEEYKRAMVEVYTRRALERAAERAGR